MSYCGQMGSVICVRSGCPENFLVGNFLVRRAPVPASRMFLSPKIISVRSGTALPCPRGLKKAPPNNRASNAKPARNKRENHREKIYTTSNINMIAAYKKSPEKPSRRGGKQPGNCREKYFSPGLCECLRKNIVLNVGVSLRPTRWLAIMLPETRCRKKSGKIAQK